jgi:hypothetical protein
LPHLGNGGMGVNRQLPHLGGGMGVNRQLPHLGDCGRGDRLQWLTEWFCHISERLQDTRICCGDWERICSVGSMTRNGKCAVLLDPPYSQTDAVYAHDSNEQQHTSIPEERHPRLHHVQARGSPDQSQVRAAQGKRLASVAMSEMLRQLAIQSGQAG